MNQNVGDPGFESNPLLALLSRCVVRIVCDQEFKGTGFFVAPGEILTCAHVVNGASEIAVVGSEWKTGAIVEEQVPKVEAGSPRAGFHPLPDVALLRLPDVPAPHPCVQLGVELPVAGINADRLWLEGFTLGEHEGGSVGGGGVPAEFESLFKEEGWDLLKFKDAQIVHGLSGGPVLNMRSGLVCGLVDSSKGETTSLGGFAVPISTIQRALPGLGERNALFHADDRTWMTEVRRERKAAAARNGAERKLPILKPLSDLKWHPDRAPSDLLKPRFGVVGLLGRESLQEALRIWREGDGRLGIVLMTGGGGYGKTRLALEECAAAESDGWTSGLFVLDAGTSLDNALDRLVDWEAPLFVAIDYAETRPNVVSSLILRLSRRVDGPPVRLILVCRQAQTRRELEELLAGGEGRDEVVDALEQADPVRLDDEQLDSRGLFEIGTAAIADCMGMELPSISTPLLREEHFARPLFVLAAALLCVQDPDVDIDSLSREDLMLELIDRHESEYWERWNENLETGLDASLQSRAVAAATMLGGSSEEEAISLVGVVPGLEDASAERKREIAQWLAHLYGDGKLADSPAISPVEPDMLGEALVVRECSRLPDLIGAALDAASDPQLTRVLTVLTRAAAADDELAAHVSNALDERLLSLVQRAVAAADAEFVAALDLAVVALRPGANSALAAEGLEAGGPAFANLAVNLLRVAIEHYGEPGEDSDSMRRTALVLSNLSSALNSLGRDEEALKPAEEALAWQRMLVERDSERHLPELSGYLNNLANRYGRAGRNQEALAPIEEAVRHYRVLAEQDPERFLPDLAMALNNLSNVLDNLGQGEPALVAIEEGVEHDRVLAEENPERYLPSLAGSLNNLATVLDNLGRGSEALGPIEEAVRHYRVLAEESPALYLPDLAMASHNLATVLDNLGRGSEALGPIEEAVRHYRVLAEQNPERFLPYLAGSINNLSNVLDNLGQGEEALGPIEEAVRHRRVLAEQNPERFLPDLVSSLNNLCTVLGNLGRDEPALGPIEEAVRHYRVLAEQNPERFLPDLATALNNLSNVLDNLGRGEEALGPIEEAVRHRRVLEEQNPERFLPDLATSLNNLSNVLDNSGRGEEALGPIEEAVRHRRVLAEQNPERYLPNLAGSLNNLATVLSSLKRNAEALGPIEEAVRHYRVAIEQNPERFLPYLARSLRNLSGVLDDLGLVEEALGPIEEVVRHRRVLAEENPERYLPDLATSLNSLSNVLDHLGRSDEALKPIEETIAEHEGRSLGGLLVLSLAEWHGKRGNIEKAVASAWAAFERVQAADIGARAMARLLLRSLREGDEAGFEAAWQQVVGIEQPVWLRHKQADPALIAELTEWLQTPTWDDSRRFSREHADTLLTDEAEAALEQLVDQNPRQPALLQHLEILAAARAEGVDMPYDRIAEEIAIHSRRELIRLWLSRGSGSDGLEFLVENANELLTPGSERDLLSAAASTPDNLALYVPAALIALSRVDSPAAAYGLLNGDLPAIADAECVRNTEEQRTLALARMRSGTGDQDADRQFQHALAAAAAEEVQEAGQAIERCRQLLPSWERPDYLRRLDALENEHPSFRGAASRLKDGLLTAPARQLSEAAGEA